MLKKIMRPVRTSHWMTALAVIPPLLQRGDWLAFLMYFNSVIPLVMESTFHLQQMKVIIITKHSPLDYCSSKIFAWLWKMTEKDSHTIAIKFVVYGGFPAKTLTIPQTQRLKLMSARHSPSFFPWWCNLMDIYREHHLNKSPLVTDTSSMVLTYHHSTTLHLLKTFHVMLVTRKKK